MSMGFEADTGGQFGTVKIDGTDSLIINKDGELIGNTGNIYDETENRILKVSDFGLGGRPGPTDAITDFDSADFPSGFYTAQENSVLNGPYNSGQAYQLAVSCVANTIGSTYHVSRITGNAANQKSWVGTKPASSNTVWNEVYNNQSAVGEVSESAGIPTGAIIESADTATGWYTKYADGTLICYHTVTAGSAYASWTPLYVSPVQTWVFPHPFVGTITTCGQVLSGGQGQYAWVVNGTASATTISQTFAVAKTTVTAAAVIYSLMAVGRWY